MTVKICTFEYMLSNVNGVGMRRIWFPQVVKEAYLQSTKDGDIKRAPDPVTMIDGDLSYFNNNPDPIHITVQIDRAPRSVVVQSPSTVILTDAWSFDKGADPAADFPSVVQDQMGGKMQIDRPAAAAADLLYGRFFLSLDAGSRYVDCGVVNPYEAIHFRYLCAVQTPGIWTIPTEFDPEWQAAALYARLLAFGTPLGSA